MNIHRNRFRPHLESLEARDNPSNLTVTFANHTLTVKGDPTHGSTLTIEGNASDPTQFTIDSTTDTFNGKSSPFSSTTGVENFSFALGGNQTVDFDDNVTPIDIEGNLSLNAGNGSNGFAAELLTVGKNVTITNGTSPTGTMGTDPNSGSTTYLNDVNVGGNVTITNGAGNFLTAIDRDISGSSTIGGNLSITTGTGDRLNDIQDTNIDGNVTISNGHAGSDGNAGVTEILDVENTLPLVVGGNLSISYLTGNGSDGDNRLCDTTVKGNVTINHGTGNFTTDFDGFNSSVPVEISGSLTLTGSGANTVNVGTTTEKTGLAIGKNLTISGGPNLLTLNKLQVGGNTSFTLGKGQNSVIVDESLFAGTFVAKIGSGLTVVEMDDNLADTAPTQFDKAVDITFATGSNTLGSLASSNQELIVMSTFVVNNISNLGNWSQTESEEFFPNGNSIVLRS